MTDPTKATNKTADFRQWLTSLIRHRKDRCGHGMDRENAKTAFSGYFKTGKTPEEALNLEWSYA